MDISESDICIRAWRKARRSITSVACVEVRGIVEILLPQPTHFYVTHFPSSKTLSRVRNTLPRGQFDDPEASSCLYAQTDVSWGGSQRRLPTVSFPVEQGSLSVAGRLLGMLALSVHNASWLILFIAGVLGVLVALLTIATLATIFDPKRNPGTRYKVFRDLLDLFRLRKQP